MLGRIAAISGVLTTGLAVSGMTNPDKVLDFLGPAGRWDPSRALVMAGALAVSAPGFASLPARTHQPGQGAASIALAAPGSQAAVGGALFGIGWGVVGCCPGRPWPTRGRAVRGCGPLLR